MPSATPAVEFSLSVTDGTPTLRVTEAAFFGWVKLSSLELQVPTRGEAIAEDADPLSFRTRRTRATRVHLRMEQSDLDAFCALRGAELGDRGIDEVSLRVMDGYLSLSARARVGGHVAEMTARILPTCGPGGIRLLIDEACCYGFLPLPAPSLAYQIVCALLDTNSSDEDTNGGRPHGKASGGRWAHVSGLAQFDVDPVDGLLWNTMPQEGWRLPDTVGLVCESTRCRAGQLSLEFIRSSHPASNQPRATNQVRMPDLAAHLESFRPADELLRSGEIASALRAYRAELSARGPDHPFLVERILSIAASQPDYFVDGLELARQALGRWPDFAPAHNALAAIASAENDGLEAAHRFQILATSHTLVGDKGASAKAALAGARLLRRLSPAESTALYELVLENSPDESEASEALAERYREENRWEDLLALIRRRVLRATSPVAAARDHIRLANVLSSALGDDHAARDELEKATSLDPDSGSAAEALAKIELHLGNVDAALAAFDNAAGLFANKGDRHNEVRLRLAAADIAVVRGNDADAEKRFKSIVETVPNEATALRGAANAASRQGRFAEAAELWRMLLVSCAESALVQAEYSFELGRCLVRDGDTEGARPALERAARSGPPQVAAEAHALLAEIFTAEKQFAAAAIELAAAVTALTRDGNAPSRGQSVTAPPVRSQSRAAELALARALLLERMDQSLGAELDFRRAFELGGERQGVRRLAARALLSSAERSDDPAESKKWISALLAATPDDNERRNLLITRAQIRLDVDGDTEGASKDLSAALTGTEDLVVTARGLRLRARLAIERGDHQSAALVLTEMAEMATGIGAIVGWTEAAEAWNRAEVAKQAEFAAASALTQLAEAETRSKPDSDLGETADLWQRAHRARAHASWGIRNYAALADSARYLLEHPDRRRLDGLADSSEHSKSPKLGDASETTLRFRFAVASDRSGDEAIAEANYQLVCEHENASAEIRSQARRHLAELYERRGDYATAAGHFRTLAEDENAGLVTSARADAWYRAAELYRKHQGRSGEAEACLEETLKLVSDHMPALDALETLKRDTDDYERVAVILGRKIAATGRHPSRQKSLLVRLAILQEKTLGRLDVARETYRRALEIDPLFRPALRFGARDNEANQDLDRAARLLAKLAGHLPGDDQVDDASELAGQQRSAALRLAKVAETLAKSKTRQSQRTTNQESSAKLTSIDELAVGVLKSALAPVREHPSKAPDDELALALESLYQRTKDWAALATMLAVPERSTPARAAQRVELLWRNLNEVPAALIAARSGCDSHPEDERLREYEQALEELTCATDSTDNPGLGEQVAQALDAAISARDAGDPIAALGHLEPIAGPAAPNELLLLRAELREANGHWERAAHDLTMLRRRASAAGDLNLEHRLCRWLATVTAEKLDDQMTALALYERALELDPDDLASAEACVSLFKSGGDRSARASALERVVAIAKRTGAGAQVRASALRNLATFALFEGRGKRAQQHLEEALEGAPGDEPTLRLLASVHADLGDVDLQSQTLRILAGTLADRSGGTSASAGELYLELADLYYDSIDDPDKGREAMMVAARVFGPGSRSRSILRLLASEANTARDFNTVITALEALGDEQLKSSDALMLAKAYARAARDHRAVSTLESARTRGRLSDEAALLLIALYRQLGRKRELARSLETGASEAPPAIAATRLSEALGLYRVTLEDDVSAERVLSQLTELAHVHHVSEHETLAQRPGPDELERAADAAASGQETAVAADLLARAVDQRTTALALAGGTLDSATHQTLDNLRALARRDGHYEALARALLSASALEASSAASSAALREAAQITRRFLHNTRTAADLLSRALALTPSDASLCEELDATLREAGDYSQLVSAYELHLGAVSGRGRAQPLLELGRLYRDVFSDFPRAENYFREVVRVAPELKSELDRDLAEIEARLGSQTIPNPRTNRRTPAQASSAALNADASTERERLGKLLERVRELEEGGQLDAAIAQAERGAAISGGDRRPLRALERLYGEIGDWGAVGEVLGRLAAVADDPAAAAEIWFRRAALYRDVLHREPEAYRCLKEAHANDPENGTIANALRAVAMARGEWALAAELLYREIAAADKPDEQGALYLELALIYDEKLLDVDAAMINYEQALKLDPEIPAAPKPLARLYELRGRHAEASQTYELAAARARSDGDRGRLLRHSALSAEHAGLSEEARRLYGLATVVGVAEDHEKAQLALARLGEADSEPGLEARIRLLEARLEETTDAKTELALRRELLELATSRGDAGAQLRLARELLESDRTEVSAYVALKKQAALAGDWQQVASLLSSRAAAVDDPKERAALYYELGRAYEDDLGDLNAAVGAYEQSLDADPNHSGALEALAEISYRKHNWVRAYPIYARLRAEDCAMPADVIALRRGEIAEALGREQEACEAFAEAVRLFPASRPALTALARTAKRIGDLERAISATRAILELAPAIDVSATTRARSELASLLARSGDTTGAIYYYELVLGEQPKAASALAELLALYSEKGDFHGAARCIRSLIALTSDAQARADLLFRLGELYRDRIGDADLAADAYLKGIDLAPDHAPILRRLLAYFFRVGDDTQLVEVASDLEKSGSLARAETGRLHLARVLVFAAHHKRWELVDNISSWFGSETSDRLVAALLEIVGTNRESWPPSLASAAGAAVCTHLGLKGTEIFDRIKDLAETNDSAKQLLRAIVD